MKNMNSDATVFGALSAFQRNRELKEGQSQYSKNYNENLFGASNLALRQDGPGSIHANNQANATLLDYVTNKKKGTVHQSKKQQADSNSNYFETNQNDEDRLLTEIAEEEYKALNASDVEQMEIKGIGISNASSLAKDKQE